MKNPAELAPAEGGGPRKIVFHPRGMQEGGILQESGIVEGEKYTVIGNGDDARIEIDRPGRGKVSYPIDTYGSFSQGEEVIFEAAFKDKPKSSE